MESLLKKMISLGLGAAFVAKRKTDEIINDLIKTGKLSQEEGKRIMDEWEQEGEKQKDQMESEFGRIMEKILKQMNIPTRKDFEVLEKRIEILEKNQSTGEANK
jgi:polyhydroxyalkanoate synthesis regulator phasin